MIDEHFEIDQLEAIGFPYLVLTFCWQWKRFGMTRKASMHCAVDRYQGNSMTLEALSLGNTLDNPILVEPQLTDDVLSQKAYQHVTQARRHHLKQRHAAEIAVEKARYVRKPLWKVGLRHRQHGDMTMLLDGVTGGYYFM